MPQLPLRHEPVHEIVHEQDEEHRIAVDGGNAGLGKVHEVEGEDHRAAGVQLYGGGPDHRRAAVHPHPRLRRGGGQRHRRHHPQSPGIIVIYSHH